MHVCGGVLCGTAAARCPLCLLTVLSFATSLKAAYCVLRASAPRSMGHNSPPLDPMSPHRCVLQTFRPSVTFNLTATDLLSSLLPLAVAVGGNLWIGGYRDARNPPWGMWSWSDGTNASNLNCGPPYGCGPWTPGQPKCVST